MSDNIRSIHVAVRDNLIVAIEKIEEAVVKADCTIDAATAAVRFDIEITPAAYRVLTIRRDAEVI